MKLQCFKCESIRVSSLIWQEYFTLANLQLQIPTCLFVVSYGFRPLRGERDWLNMVKNIFVGCWQVKGKQTRKDWLHKRFSKDVPRGKKNYSVNYVKQNTHIRYSSYLTKLCLIFILARFALVLIPAIQFSISGTYC